MSQYHGHSFMNDFCKLENCIQRFKTFYSFIKMWKFEELKMQNSGHEM